MTLMYRGGQERGGHRTRKCGLVQTGDMVGPEKKHFSFIQKTEKMSPDRALRKNPKNLTWLPHHGS